jgi:hypothetical protein
MSITDKIGSKIPTDFKTKIPVYQNIKSFDKNIRFFLENQKTMKEYSLDKRYNDFENKIQKFYKVHEGQRCFIMGCGPSLNKTNINLIKNEIIFGVNTLYKGMNKFGFDFEYYAISDYNVWQEHYKQILSLNTTLFIGSQVGKMYLSEKEKYQKYQKKDPIIIRSLGQLRFSNWKIKDMSFGLYDSHQIVSAMCLQIAYYMGFKEVYLLGCDCDYTGKQHFDGEKRQLDQGKYTNSYWAEVFDEYKIIKDVFEEDNRKIYNSTVGGKLEVFERKKLEEVI